VKKKMRKRFRFGKKGLEDRCLQGLKGYETAWELQEIPLPETLFISRSHTASQERYPVRREARVMRIIWYITGNRNGKKKIRSTT
jgi:hypothetical protein